jgi:tRNA(Ile)-lysidine synthase
VPFLPSRRSRRLAGSSSEPRRRSDDASFFQDDGSSRRVHVRAGGQNVLVAHGLSERVERFVRRHDLIASGGEVTCLVSGGADSTCLWHVLGSLGYRVSAVHVSHGLRGEESEEDARFCAEVLGADVVRPSDSQLQATSEAALRDVRYALTSGRGLRATGHTASDQVETVLYRLVSSGSTRGIKARREDGVVRPLLPLWREETEAYCRQHGLDFRLDSSNRDTKRGLIRSEILPLLRRLHPGAEANLLALADERPRLPRELERTLLELLSSGAGTKEADLGAGVRAVREYDTLRLEGRVEFGPWRLEADAPGLTVRTRRPGDRLAGRRKKVQDLLVDAKVPRRERDGWPIVVSGGEVVAVPGVAEAPGWEGVVRAWKDSER